MIKKSAYAFIPSALFCLVMWFVKTIELRYDMDFAEYGVLPRTIIGLRGIIFSPFIHGDLEHIYSNTFPVLILGTMILFFFEEIWLQVYTLLFFMSGIGLWIIGRENFHIGASGFVYGMVGFIFFSGVFRKDFRLLALSMLIVFLYGGLIWGVFPILIHVSWEAHLAGLLSGFFVAYMYRKQGPKKILFQWEHDEIEEMMESNAEVLETKINRKVSDTTNNEVNVNYIYKEKQKE